MIGGEQVIDRGRVDVCSNEVLHHGKSKNKLIAASCR